MANWIRVNDRPRSEQFRCPKCGEKCTCKNYEVHNYTLLNVCNYVYCPYCGAEILDK